MDIMISRNPNLGRLKANYLFPEIAQRKKRYCEEHPDKKVISLGIGDTTQPIPDSVSKAFAKRAFELSTFEGYSGYGPEQGAVSLRKMIASEVYGNLVQPDDIFISDGAKCDIGRLQLLFGSHVSIAVQDPTYPVYLEGSILHGVENIVFLPCSPENRFFPDLAKTPRTDIIYFCSPNNPTGAVASKEQLSELVRFAKKNGSLIVFDAAYSFYIQDDSLPKTIFEIEGALETAIEVHSFSKVVGFTGVRLGWTVVPEALKYRDGGSVRADWKRVITTIFNGASNIAQAGGEAAFENNGADYQKNIRLYLENAGMIRKVFLELGFEVFGGEHAPFVWVKFGKDSWEVFQELLENLQIVATPGAGFGKEGQNFMRFSAFSKREDIEEALYRLKKVKP